MRLSLTPIDPPTVEGPPDEMLLRRLRGGDASAGDVLVRRYHPSLLRYLQRLSGSGHLAEELVQATWLSVLEHIDKFDSSAAAGGFKAWLFRIATNKAHDIWRSRGREKVAHDEMKRALPVDAPAADLPAETSEEKLKLERAIERLPETQRTVLLLRYYGQMKFVDIARTMGCPLNTALGRMHKAMLALKHLMEEQAMEDETEELGEDQALLILYLAGELPAEQHSALERRLASDDALLRELEALRSAQAMIWQEMLAADSAQPPRGMVSAAHRKLAGMVRQWAVQRLAREPAPHMAKYSLRRWSIAVAAAAAVLIASLIYFYQPREQDEVVITEKPAPAPVEHVNDADAPDDFFVNVSLNDVEQELNAMEQLRTLTQ